MSWWGTVWTSAMVVAFGEARELEIGARLARRLTLPASAIEMSPGAVVIRDPDDEWVAQLGCRQLDEGQWGSILRAIAADPELTAAVITGELPIEVHARAVAMGCSLAPEPADIGADCSCPDWHEPCRHVGALVAVAAELIDQDPWLLAMLRGGTRDHVVDTVRRLRSEQRGIEWVDTGDEPRGADPGVPAASAFRATPRPLPPALPMVRRPASPVGHRPPPADAGLQPADLHRLAADAAQRAFALLSGDEDGDALTLSVLADAARIAADLEAADPRWEVVADAVGVDIDQMRRLAVGWQLAGSAGVEAVAHPAELSPEQLARAGQALPGGRTSRRAVSEGERQLRADGDGRWWSFVRHDSLGWVISSGPASEPGQALDD